MGRLVDIEDGMYILVLPHPINVTTSGLPFFDLDSELAIIATFVFQY